MATWAFRLIVKLKSAQKAEVKFTAWEAVKQDVREAYLALTVQKRLFRREKGRALVAIVGPPPPLLRGSLPLRWQ